MKKLTLITILTFINNSFQGCTNFWNANLNDPNEVICPSIDFIFFNVNLVFNFIKY